jgi:flagellar hook-basal body complex protein FliE
MVRVARCLALVIGILSVACSEPPNKEMNLAQGAIEAARAAGADRFASAELTAAVDALKRSHEAASGNDYRQALSHALDSFERAQNAAKLAVEGRANARGEAERTVAQVATLLATADTQLKASPLPARSLKTAQDTIATAGVALQKARAALEMEDYLSVGPALEGVAAALEAALTQIAAPEPPAPSRRKR